MACRHGARHPVRRRLAVVNDTVAGAEATSGTNAVVVARCLDSEDAYAVGAVRVHWKVSADGDPGASADTWYLNSDFGCRVTVTIRVRFVTA